MYVRQFRAILSVVTHLFGTSNLICSRTHPPLLFSGLGPLFLLFILLFSRPILLDLTRGAWRLYFVVLARNCVASTLDYIVVHMRKTNRGMGYSIKTDACLLSLRLDFQPFCEPAFLAPHQEDNRTPITAGNRA